LMLNFSAEQKFSINISEQPISFSFKDHEIQKERTQHEGGQLTQSS